MPLASSSCFLNCSSTTRLVFFHLLGMRVQEKRRKKVNTFRINASNVAKRFCLNQQLKSVAHLPWKAFMYKVRPGSCLSGITGTHRYSSRVFSQAFNTFIDDVFAFIITMPTSHRLACFRDDVVFLIYLYQRWYTHTHAHTQSCSLNPLLSASIPPGSILWTRHGSMNMESLMMKSPRGSLTRTRWSDN